MFKTVWMSREEAIALLGLETFLMAAREGAIEAHGNRSFAGHDWADLPKCDWWHGSVPMIEGRQVQGIPWAFGATASARWYGVEVRRADVEALMPDTNPTGQQKRGKRTSSGGRQERPIWALIEPAAFRWLIENGEPVPGDGGQAEFERHLAKLVERHQEHASETTIRTHAKKFMVRFKL